jgi:hypothetical protein
MGWNKLSLKLNKGESEISYLYEVQSTGKPNLFVHNYCVRVTLSVYTIKRRSWQWKITYMYNLQAGITQDTFLPSFLFPRAEARA